MHPAVGSKQFRQLAGGFRTEHNKIKGLQNDYEKFTEASLRGWMLILIDSQSVRDGRAVTWVERALGARTGEGRGAA